MCMRESSPHQSTHQRHSDFMASDPSANPAWNLVWHCAFNLIDFDSGHIPAYWFLPISGAAFLTSPKWIDLPMFCCGQCCRFQVQHGAAQKNPNTLPTTPLAAQYVVPGPRKRWPYDVPPLTASMARRYGSSLYEAGGHWNCEQGHL